MIRCRLLDHDWRYRSTYVDQCSRCGECRPAPGGGLKAMYMAVWVAWEQAHKDGLGADWNFEDWKKEHLQPPVRKR